MDQSENMKEAAELLECMDIDDGVLEKIVVSLDEIVKNNPIMQNLVKSLENFEGFDDEIKDFKAMVQFIEEKGLLPQVFQFLQDLQSNDSIVKDFEEKILPLLFTSK